MRIVIEKYLIFREKNKYNERNAGCVFHPTRETN